MNFKHMEKTSKTVQARTGLAAAQHTKAEVKLRDIWKDAAKGNTSKVKSRVGKGEHPDVLNEERRTPLHYAAEFGHPDTVTVLLAAGANINARDIHHDTPVLLAAKSRNEEMIMFLASKGADLELSGSSAMSAWDLAERLNKRLYLKLKEQTRCSNNISKSDSVIVKPKPVVESKKSMFYNPLLTQVVTDFGQYLVSLMQLPNAKPEPRPAPFPPTPQAAVQLSAKALLASVEKLFLETNRSVDGPANAIKQSLTSFRLRVVQADNVLKNMNEGVFASLTSDCFSMVSTLLEAVVAYEEAVVGRALNIHLEKFSASFRDALSNELRATLVFDFVNLYRNVIVQIMCTKDHEKAKMISDGLQMTARLLQAFVVGRSQDVDPAKLQTLGNAIFDQLGKIQNALSRSGAGGALFDEEEIEIFASVAPVLEPLIAIQNQDLPRGVMSVAKIILAESQRAKNTITQRPVNADPLVPSALFVAACGARLPRALTNSKLTTAHNDWNEVAAGLLAGSGNLAALVACALACKNRAFSPVHIGYAFRAAAYASTLLLDPKYTFLYP